MKLYQVYDIEDGRQWITTADSHESAREKICELYFSNKDCQPYRDFFDRLGSRRYKNEVLEVSVTIKDVK